MLIIGILVANQVSFSKKTADLFPVFCFHCWSWPCLS